MIAADNHGYKAGALTAQMQHRLQDKPASNQ
jgi:hypothetical protein